MLEDIYELIEMVANRGHLVPFLVGGLLTAAAMWRFVRNRPAELTQELRGQISELELNEKSSEQTIDQLRGRVEELADQRDAAVAVAEQRGGQLDALRERLTQTSEDCERLVQDRTKLESYARRLKRERAELRDQVQRLSDQIDMIAADDGRLWLKPTGDDRPEFMPLGVRKTPIVSVANLKGGVGKTTIAANLGVTFAASGARVLLIDLDHQSSLSSLCMDAKERYERQRAGLTVETLFRCNGGLGDLHACTMKLEVEGIQGRMYLAPVTEALSDLENQLAHRWAAGLEECDIRYILRKALHDQGLADAFDLVVIDCPPRLTTGCVNALAASDYVLVPVLLQDTSAEAVPRMLSWLRRFRDQVSAHLDLAGIVGNRAFPRNELIAREKNVWEALRHRCTEAWGNNAPFLTEVIRDHSTYSGRYAALDPKYRQRYERLASEIREALPNACFQSAAVHSTSGPSADGVGD